MSVRQRTGKGEKSSATVPNGKQRPESAKAQNNQVASGVRRVVVLLGLLAVAWFGKKTFSTWFDPTQGSGSPAAPGSTASTSARIPIDFPKVLHPHLDADVEKREAIKAAFRDSWDAYVRDAWGKDEYHPLSRGGSDLTRAGPIGYQIVDAIDGLLILGMEDEYARARDWIRDELRFDDKDAEYSTFETTIRLLGGLLSAHYLAANHSSPVIQADAPMYLEKSVDLADRLLVAFETPTGIPWSNVNLARRKGIPDRDNQGLTSLAEAASLQLELKYLSHLTGDMVYWKKAERVTEIVRSQAIHDGIAPIFIAPQNGQFVQSEIRLGSRGDSYYEYLLKQWLQTDRQEPVYRDVCPCLESGAKLIAQMYDEAMGGIKKHMLDRTRKSGLIFTQELHPVQHPQTGQRTWQIVPKQDHLVCFLGGSLILGVTEGGRRQPDWYGPDPSDREDYEYGKGIIESCVRTYQETATGLGPEIAMFVKWTEERAADVDWYIKANTHGLLIDGRNILRPETVESLFLAYRATGDEIYRTWGWEIFQAFEKWCKVPTGGYAGIDDVQAMPPKQHDRMETFWLGETLKYLYLLFDDSDHIPLDQVVFNTEAHILPVFKPAALTAFSTA